MKANIDLLESNDERLDNKKNYNMIRKELNKINELMLEFINITQSSYSENYDFVYIYDILDNIVKRYSSTYGKKTHFTTNAQSTEFYILGNEKSIYILFNNIIKNSLEAIDENGTIAINITKDDNNIIVTIKDDGKGMDKDLKNKVYENYFTTKELGNGLGLSICQKVVQDHKGDFKITNNNDKGCIVKVTLPLYKDNS